MKKDLEKVKEIIRKYNIKTFENEKEIKKWLKKLNDLQYENLINLDIEPQNISFIKELLINNNLLNCKDYDIRIQAMSRITYPDDCRYLVDKLCDEVFLNNKNYYLSMVLLAKANYLKYCLWLINENVFINNIHYIDDMNMVAKAKDEITAQTLSEVAQNRDSLNSKYHRRDMEIISKCKGKQLQPTGMFPPSSINNLAVNRVSLNDPYHEENMLILAENTVAKGYLYSLMINEKIINGKEYRREIARLNKAKTKKKARAIYYFIINPDRTTTFDFFDDMKDETLDIDYTLFDRSKNIEGKNNPRYNFYLKLLNEVDDNYVTYISYLLSNKYLLNSPYLDEDIKHILKITNKKIFYDLFIIMQNESSLKSMHHFNDMLLISKEENDIKRKMLLSLATNKDNLKSATHQYDMLFVSSLNVEELSQEELDYINYFLFNPKGIFDIEHIYCLENMIHNGMMINIKKKSKLIKKLSLI